jgi:hypothetical protein
LLHKYNENIIGDFDNPEENTIIYNVRNELGRKPTEEDRKQIEERAKEIFQNDRRRKRLRIYMTASTYKKYINMLNLYSKNDYDITIIKSGDTINLKDPVNNESKKYADGLHIKAIYAKHDDLMSDHDSVGFLVEYHDFLLVYTGDTGFDSKVEAYYNDIKKEVGTKQIILLAHLGGFKSYETRFDGNKTTEENKKAFYKNHLGRLGIAKLVEILKPKLCIISEFGEEFRRTRMELVKIYKDLYKEMKTRFFAADINFIINEEGKVKAITALKGLENGVDNREFIDPDLVLTCERKADYSLHYYKKDGLRESDIIEALVTQYFSNHS